MNENSYSSQEVADDATEYSAACALLQIDPDDADARSTVAALNAKYGDGFFTD